MSDEEKAALRQATMGEVRDTLSFALRFDSRKRVQHADEAMAQITAERLIKHLERSGYVLMKRPGHSTFDHNSLSERLLRGTAITRKNYLFVGSDRR